MRIVHRDETVPFTTKDSSVVREILRPENSPLRRQSLAEATLRPGATTLAHSHPNTEEVYYLLQGQGIMAIETEQQAVSAGDAIAIPAGQRHQIMNVGAGDLVLLCCCVPPYTDTDTVLCDPLIR